MNDIDINIVNFRSLNNILTKDKRKIREGILYRGGPFSNLNHQDKYIIDKIGFKHIFDFRSLDELKREERNKEYLYYPIGAKYHNYAKEIRKELDIDLDFLNGLNKNNFISWLISYYQILPYDNLSYKNVFNAIKNKEFPIYFHCSAGKDRTGVCAALILNMLGVDRKDIIEEYMLSLSNMIKLIGHFEEKDKNKEKTLRMVDENWILEMFKELDKRYPDNDDYYLKEYGIDKDIKEQIKNYCLI